MFSPGNAEVGAVEFVPELWRIGAEAGVEILLPHCHRQTTMPVRNAAAKSATNNLRTAFYMLLREQLHESDKRSTDKKGVYLRLRPDGIAKMAMLISMSQIRPTKLF